MWKTILKSKFSKKDKRLLRAVIPKKDEIDVLMNHLKRPPD